MEYNVLGSLRNDKSNRNETNLSSINQEQVNKIYWQNFFIYSKDFKEIQSQIDKKINAFLSDLFHRKPRIKIELTEDKIRSLFYQMVLSNSLRNINIFEYKKNDKGKFEMKLIDSKKILSIVRMADIDRIVNELLLIPTLLLKQLHSRAVEIHARKLYRFLQDDKRNRLFFWAYFKHYQPTKKSDSRYTQEQALIDANEDVKYYTGLNPNSKVLDQHQEFRNWLYKMRKTHPNFKKLGFLLKFN